MHAGRSCNRLCLQAKAVLVHIQEVIQDNTPEELTPLVEALERAKRQQEEATGIREALEAEVILLPLSDITPSVYRNICMGAD